jgi:hypothetical protein
MGTGRNQRRGSRVAVAGLLFGMGACQGASSSTGLEAMLRVQGAQAVSGNINDPPAQQTAVVVSGLTTPSNVAFPGSQGHGVAGKIGPGATAVAIGIPRDGVYWILPGGGHDSTTPDLLLFSSLLDFSPAVTATSSVVELDETGRPTLPVTFRAVAASGQMGPSLQLTMRLQDNTPTGTLVFSLRWASPVDLDLRVVAPLPDGSGSVEISSKHGSNLPPDTSLGSYKDKGAIGTLDFDSNAGCRIDNRDRENVVWTGVPPAGNYIVRVDAFSLCGQQTAEWEVRATWNGEIINKDDGQPADVFGIATEAATARDHGAGAGTTAFQIDLQLQQ